MKKVFQLVGFIFMFAAISFVEYSYAYKANPTQPTLLDLSHSSPTPNYSNCTLAFNACGAQNYSSFTDPIYLIDYCGDPVAYEIFSLTVGDPLNCAETEFPRPINCNNCSCPSGQSRVDAMCVPDAALSCQQGIANYLTGECYPDECPYGDGSPEQCKQVEFCPEQEETVLLNSSCVCQVDTEWNPHVEACVEIIPNCDGENGSAIGSFFNFETETCNCPSSTIFDTQTNICERQGNSICEFDEYYGVDSACHKYPGGPFLTNLSCNYAYSGNPDPQLNAGIKQACSACVAAGGSPILYEVSNYYDTEFPWSQRTMAGCFMPEDSPQACESNGYYWDEENTLCREIPSSSSSSASSNSSSNSSSISSVSSSSGSASSASSSLNNNGGNNGGGSGSSSGTNNSSGGGTGGNGNGDGSGGNGTSAGSAASSGNNSSSGAGECDPEAKDYLECVAPGQSPLPSHTPTDSGFTSVDQVNQAFMNRVSNSPIVQSFQNFENIITVQNAECPVLSIDLTDVPPINSLLESDIHCQIFENIRPIISVVMFAVFAFLGFRIFASA